MPLTRVTADLYGVVTICLVVLLVILCILCAYYLVSFRSWIWRQGFVRLGYFNGPWIIRVSLILTAIWWGLGEIVRLTFLKGKGKVLQGLSLKWQENLCKFYILSNLGFAEPSMLLTFIFLLHASLQRSESGTLNGQWNSKALRCIALICFPIFVVQLLLVLIGPKLNNKHPYGWKMPNYFTGTSVSFLNSGSNHGSIALCTYPLVNTIVLGLFSFLVIAYSLYLGAQMLSLVINNGLRKRVYMLIFSFVGFLPLRAFFLGFSILSHPGHLVFESLVFMAFIVLLSFIVVGICTLVYCPIADSFAVSSLLHLEMQGEPSDINDSALSPIASQRLLEAD